MRDLDELAACCELRFNQSPGPQPLFEIIQALDKVRREFFDRTLLRRVYCARRVKCDLAVKAFVRLKIISDVVNLIEPDAAALETKLDGAKGQPAGVVHSDVPDPSKFLFFDRGNNSAVLNQRCRRVTLLP